MKKYPELKNDVLRKFPSVREILEDKSLIDIVNNFPHEFIKERLNDIINVKREEALKSISGGGTGGQATPFSPGYFAEELLRELNNFSFSLRKVVNGTGVVVHTNLGRSVLPESALKNVELVAGSYSNLEFNLESGKRGKRYSHSEYLLKKILKCESAIVVNNNAAAVFMALSSFCSGQKKEVIVSRGELIEIGGSFRIPDIMKASGALLVEVGTTNKTRSSDYENGITGDTALLLKVHQSNFRIRGFTSEILGRELVSIGKKHLIPVMEDLGSGSFIDIRKFGLPYEPTAQEVLEAGVDIVTFSGDKLLGGPQAGIIAGKKEYVDMIAANPLNRAFRIDKMTLAALEAVLFEYLDEESAMRKITTLFLLSQKYQDIRKRARRLLTMIYKNDKFKKNDFAFKIVKDASVVGGGAIPDNEIETASMMVTHKSYNCVKLGELFRNAPVPVIGKIKNDEFMLDLRTIKDSELINVLAALEFISSLKED